MIKVPISHPNLFDLIPFNKFTKISEPFEIKNSPTYLSGTYGLINEICDVISRSGIQIPVTNFRKHIFDKISHFKEVTPWTILNNLDNLTFGILPSRDHLKIIINNHGYSTQEVTLDGLLTIIKSFPESEIIIAGEILDTEEYLNLKS